MNTSDGYTFTTNQFSEVIFYYYFDKCNVNIEQLLSEHFFLLSVYIDALINIIIKFFLIIYIKAPIVL